MGKRYQYFDVMKFVAIMWIFAVHFIDAFRPDLFRFWSTYPTSLILQGISGKFATTMLAVILGYLAYYKGSQSKSLSSLILKRYITFFIMGLFSNLIYSLHNGRSLMELSTLKEILIVSVKIGSQIFPTFWCMYSFFWGSVLSYINGKYSISTFPILMQILLLILTNNIWMAICLMGNVLFRIVKLSTVNPHFHNFISNYKIQVLIFLYVFFAVKRSESTFTYVIDGICSVLILTLIIFNPRLEQLFSNHVLSYLGKYSMGVFILHPAVYSLVGYYLLTIPSDSILSFLVAFAVSVLVTIALSIIFVSVINKFSYYLAELLICLKDHLYQAISKKA